VFGFISFICLQDEEDASVHARICPDQKLLGFDGRVAMEQKHHR